MRRGRRNFRTPVVSLKSQLPLPLADQLPVGHEKADRKMLRAKIDLKSTRICSPNPFSFQSLRSGESDGSDWRSFKKWIRDYSDLFHSQLTLSNVDEFELSCRVEFLRTISNSSSEREKVLSALLYVLHKAWTLGTLRRSRAVWRQGKLFKRFHSRCQQLHQFVTTKESV